MSTLSSGLYPALFVLGDSISIGYGPALERMVAGRMQYDRKGYALLGSQGMDSPLINGGDSRSVLAYLQDPATPLPPECAVLLLNCGLHDLRTDRHSGARQVEIDSYAQNLEKILHLVAGQAGGRAVWVSTTPVCDARHNRLNSEFARYDADVVAYNARAGALMHAAGVPVVDLYRFTLGLCAQPEDLESLYVDHVHFTQEVSRLQAAYLAGWLEAFL